MRHTHNKQFEKEKGVLCVFTIQAEPCAGQIKRERWSVRANNKVVSKKLSQIGGAEKKLIEEKGMYR